MIVWEEKWHTEGLPNLGDYIQLRVAESNDLDSPTDVLEGFVSRLNYPSPGGISIDSPGEWPDGWGWGSWRRGALPEFRSVVRRVAVDA